MNKIVKFIGVFLCIATISGCVASKEADYEWVGGILTGANVVYTVNKINSSKYLLEANTAQGLSSDKLVAAYKIKGAKLCHPKTASFQYTLGTERYMGTFNATMRLPMTAPKVTGVVTCK